MVIYSLNGARKPLNILVQFEKVVERSNINHALPRQSNITTKWENCHKLVSYPPVSYPLMGIGASFWWRDAHSHQPVWIMEETLESGNLFSNSSISVSLPSILMPSILICNVLIRYRPHDSFFSV